MEQLLRNLAEKDIEKILDREKILDKNFFMLILHFLLENSSIDLMMVDDLSKELEKDYKEFLDVFELELFESNGEIINVLQHAIRKFKKRMSPILEKVNKIKQNASS